MENRFYVYHLINPETNRVFYVGKGTGNRCKQHLVDKPNYCFNKRLNGYINNLRKNGIKPEIIKIKENLTEEESYLFEESEIIKYGRKGIDENGILMNVLINGRPPTYRGEEHPFYGRKHTEETKQKISKRKKEQYASGEVINHQKGKPLTESAKRKISLANSGKKRTPEAIEKTRLKNLGKKQTEFQKQKAREANIKKWRIKKPDGEVIIIENLRLYCVENNLDQGNMCNVARGKLKQYKGYVVEKLD